MKNNKGYTLVEMIIVIAIMGILAGLSFATFAIVDEARCSAAVNTLNNQMSNCLIQTKAISAVDKPMCLVIKKRSTDNVYVIMKGTLDGSNVNGVDDTADEKCEAILPRQITKITYTPTVATQKHTATTDEQIILQFVKSDGTVCYGAGQYDLYTKKSGTERIYASIYVDPISGKHYIK